ncbi:hypothetical protein, partial [Amycolatopsis tolypomycina]|uniref:hypothetical protein n=1 Tax=Amycolatopsis tolypomycina TaxID=208445 RepID=UPI0033A8B7A7
VAYVMKESFMTSDVMNDSFMTFNPAAPPGGAPRVQRIGPHRQNPASTAAATRLVHNPPAL